MFQIYTIVGDIMFKTMENLKLIDIMRRPASKHRVFKNRFSHALIFKISGESLYNFEGTEIIHNTGELLFIPKGQNYSLHCECEKSEYLLINFDAEIQDARVQKHCIENYFDLDFIYKNLEKLWLFGAESQRYKCISVFYDIISFITQKQDSNYALKSKLSKIKNADKYLQDHIFDSTLKSGTLASLCNMSDTYFRKIFKACYGLNPHEYINAKRLARAKAVLACGDYKTVSEVAQSVGFDDALYFSKLFKEKYGVPPSKYVSID